MSSQRVGAAGPAGRRLHGVRVGAGPERRERLHPATHCTAGPLHLRRPFHGLLWVYKGRLYQVWPKG